MLLLLSFGRCNKYDGIFVSIPIHYHLFWSPNGTYISDIRSSLAANEPSFGPLSRSIFNNATANAKSVNVSAVYELSKSFFPAALHVMAEIYFYGVDPIPQNFTKAVRFLKKAGRLGFAESMSLLAFGYRHGIGVRRNSAKEAIYRSIACTKGSASACLADAHASFRGDFGVKSVYAGVNGLMPIGSCLARMSAKQMLPLAVPVRLGRGLLLPAKIRERERGEFALLKYRAERGDAFAASELGRVFYYGKLGQNVDLKLAREFFERNPGDRNAVAHLGKMYHFGEGVPIDRAKAEQYYTRAMEMGALNGMNSLGVLKQEAGLYEEGAKLIEKAASKGHDSAAYNVALDRAAKGLMKAAIATMTRVANRGIMSAQMTLAKWLTSTDFVFNPETAFRWLHRVCVRGPWLRLSTAAEEFWRDGNRAAAILLWMELADCGNVDAAYNAGRALLELSADRLFATEEVSKKLAVTMFKRFTAFSREDISPYLFKAYLLRGQMEKAQKMMAQVSRSAFGTYLVADAHLIGVFPMTLCALFGNISRLIQKDRTYVLPVVALLPKILLESGRYCARCFGDRRDDQLDDVRRFLWHIWKDAVDTVTVLIGVAAIVILGRRRLASFYT
jgi:TPR repeat protein